MRIMVVTNLFPPEMLGGYEVLCKEMTEYLAARHEVRVVTSSGGLYGPMEVGSRDLLDGSSVHACDYEVVRILPTPTGYALQQAENPRLLAPSVTRLLRGFDQASAALLLREIADYRPEVLYMFNPLGCGPVGLLAVAAASVPLVVHLEDHLDITMADALRSDDPARGLLASAKARSWAISCSSVILPGNAMFGRFERIELVQNWVRGETLAASAPNAPGGAGRASLKAGRGIRAVSFGQILPQKGVDRAVQAAEVYNDRYGPLTIDVFGDLANPFAKDLQAMAERSRHRDQLHFRGRLPREELLAKLHSYDVALLPLPESEPFGLVVLEAMAAGCPVVTTSPCGATEWLSASEEYVPVAPQASPEAIASALKDAVGSGLLADMRKRAREVIVDRFDLEAVVAPRVEAILAEAAERLGPPSLAEGLAAAERMLYMRRLADREQPGGATRENRFRYRLVDEVVAIGDRAGIPWGAVRDRIRRAGHLARRVGSQGRR
jgi:glycosyltransferase involved in cell wall biosynthesis